MKSFFTFFKLRYAISFNTFIYRLKQLPLIKKLVRKEVYRNKIERIIWSLIYTLFTILRLLFSNLTYLFFIGFSIFLIGNEFTPDFQSDSFIQTYELMFLGTSVVFGSFINSLTAASLDNYYAVRLMKANCKQYLWFEFLMLYLPKLAILLPFTFFVANLSNTSILIALMMCASWVMLRVFSLFFELFISKFKRYKGIKLVMIAISALVTIGCALLLINKNAFFIDWRIVLIISAFLVLIGYAVNRKFDYEALAIKRFTLNDVVKAENVAIEMTKQSVKISDKDYELSASILDKKGFVFFNDVFMSRHRRLLLKPILIYSSIIAVAIIISILAGFFYPEVIKGIADSLAERVSVFFFMMYFINRGENYTNALFFNCDVSMLRYSFYRSPKNILTNFWIRFRNLAVLNMIPSILLVILVLILFMFSGLGAFDMFMYAIQILEISLLFSIHYLFLYTMFQPYTENLQQKSYIARFSHSFLYILFYILREVKLPILPAFITVTIIMILYALIGSWAIMKYASNRFRLR